VTSTYLALSHLLVGLGTLQFRNINLFWAPHTLHPVLCTRCFCSYCFLLLMVSLLLSVVLPPVHNPQTRV
jgi:hypothetical protein